MINHHTLFQLKRSAIHTHNANTKHKCWLLCHRHIYCSLTNDRKAGSPSLSVCVQASLYSKKIFKKVSFEDYCRLNLIFLLWSKMAIYHCEWRLWYPGCVTFHKVCYYSFKIFLSVWLAKIPRIIRHNQLSSTKFGRILRYVKNCQIIERLTEKTWERGWVVLVVTRKCRNISLVSRVRNRQNMG